MVSLKDKNLKKGDLGMLIDRGFDNPRIFLFEEFDGSIAKGRRGMILAPPVSMGDVQMPNPVRLKLNDEWYTIENDEIYVGVAEITSALKRKSKDCSSYDPYHRLFESYLENPD